MKKIFIACDHAGLETKNALIYATKNLPWVDLGTSTADSVDYPDFADQLCQQLISEISNTQISNNEMPTQKLGPLEIFGVLICGTGQGMAIRANRYPQIRAALCFNAEITKLSREHNNANVMVLAGRFITPIQAAEFLKIFAETAFAGGRHSARVAKLSKT